MHLHIRPLSWGDIEAIARLHRASEPIDHGGRIGEAVVLLHRWRRPGFSPEHCLVAEAGGAIVGYVYRSHLEGTDICQVDGVVHPALRRRGIGLQLLERVAAEARLAGARVLDARVREDETAAVAFCQATGFRPVRVWYRMWLEPVRVPPGAVPPGYALRTFRPHHDEATYASVVTRAFAGHWGVRHTTPERVAGMVSEPGFDPADIVLATCQADVVGAAHVRFIEREVAGRRLGVGHIGSLGVLPDHRGCGLGRALLFACLRRCRQRHVRAAELDVDEGNEPAIRLYRACGFETLFRILWYRRELER